jgi:hypothetical protein
VKSTVAYRRQNGRYFVAIGGTTATSVYNPSPTTETFSAGPTANTTGREHFYCQGLMEERY